MKHKAMLLLKYTSEEWKSLNIWVRFKLKMFSFLFGEILELEVEQ